MLYVDGCDFQQERRLEIGHRISEAMVSNGCNRNYQPDEHQTNLHADVGQPLVKRWLRSAQNARIFFASGCATELLLP